MELFKKNQLPHPILAQHGLVFLIILIGFALRAFALNDVEINPDEIRQLKLLGSETLWGVLSMPTQHSFPEHTLANILIWLSMKLGQQLVFPHWQGIFFGVLALPLIYKATKTILGPSFGLAAIFLVALSQRHIYFSHQIRGYAPLIFFAIASFHFLWLGLQSHHRRNWIFFALTSALAIYSHFFAITLLATQGIIVAIWLPISYVQQHPKPGPFWRRQVMPPLVAGTSSVVIASILLAPNLLPGFAAGFKAAPSDFVLPTVSLIDFLTPYLDLFQEFSGLVPIWSGILFLVLILTGVAYSLRFKPEAMGILLGWLIIPLLLVTFAQTFIGWFYVRNRYLTYLLPAFIILAATGWVGLVKMTTKIKPRLGLVVLGLSLAIISAISGMSISNYLQTTTEGNWQAVSEFLVEKARPTDFVICEPFTHGWKDADLSPTDKCTNNVGYRYDSQTETIYPVYNLYAVARYKTFIENPILLERNPRLWVILWQLPALLDYQGNMPHVSFHRFGQTMLLGPITSDNSLISLIQILEQLSTLSDDPSTRFALLTRLAELQAALGETENASETLARVFEIMPDHDEARNQIAMIEQHLNQPPLIAMPQHNLSANFGDKILLKGYSLTPESPLPGQPLELTLFWQASAPIEAKYSIFLHWRDETNQTVAQFDFSPNQPTSNWWAGSIHHDVRQLNVPAELPPGRYRLLVGLYHSGNGQRLSLENDSTGENAIELLQFNYQR